MQLGRFGDIINILPVVRYISDNFAKPTMMVAEEFGSILEGVSYCDRHVVPLHYSKLHDAIALANAGYTKVLVTQVWGHDYCQEKRCKSFSEESWRMANMLHLYDDPTMLPRFDLRDYYRESVLVDSAMSQYEDSKLPIIAVCLHGGMSSPFGHASLFLEMIKAETNGKAHIVNLSAIKAHRLYDLLAIFEHSDLLVTIDTAIHHLAAATSIPTIVLHGQEAWIAAKPRCNLIAQFGYGDAAANPAAVMDCIAEALKTISNVEAT